MDVLRLAVTVPMLVKHAWTALNSPRGKYPRGFAAKAAAVYEAAFYAWALLGAPPSLHAPLLLYALIHFAGVPLYFRGYLLRYSRYGLPYAAFEASELALLAALLAAA